MQVEEYHPVNYTTDCEYFSKMRIPFVNIINDFVLKMEKLLYFCKAVNHTNIILYEKGIFWEDTLHYRDIFLCKHVDGAASGDYFDRCGE